MIENEDGTVTLSKERYIELDDAEMMLSLLEINGVDNWGGYDDTREEFEEWKKEHERG